MLLGLAAGPLQHAFHESAFPASTGVKRNFWLHATCACTE